MEINNRKDELLNDNLLKGSIEKLAKSAETKRNNIVDSINKTQLALHKFVKAEECGDKFLREIKSIETKNEKDLGKIEMDFKVSFLNYLEFCCGTK